MNTNDIDKKSLENAFNLFESGEINNIEVGTKMTQFHWSDRTAWEVIAVKDQKHVTVRELSAKCIGGAYSNDWELTSNPNGRTMELGMRGNKWYNLYRDRDTKKIYHWEKVNVSFGYADYYYDYSF